MGILMKAGGSFRGLPADVSVSLFKNQEEKLKYHMVRSIQTRCSYLTHMLIFQFFFFNKFAKMSPRLFFSVNMGCRVDSHEK